MTIAALSNALTGLQATQRALAAVSNNIVNAKTEGYTRKIAEFESLNFGQSSGGVRIGDIRRNVNEYLMRDRRESLGEQEESRIQAQFLETVEQLFGTLKDNESVSALVNQFGTALDQMVTFPEDVFKQRVVVDVAEEIATRLGFINERLQDLRVQADQQIERAVNDVNDILEKIDEYNVQIARAQAVDPEGGIDEDLRDKRDVQLNRLAELMDIAYYEDSNGTVSISTVGGITLLNVDPVRVTHTAAVALDQGIEYDPDERAVNSPNGVIAGIFVGMRFTKNDDITGSILRGKIKGLIDVRDDILPNLQRQLDTLAETMQVQINRVHNLNSAFPPPTTLNGTRVMSTYNPVGGSFDSTTTAIASQLLSATGHIRLTVVTRSPSPAAGETVETLSIDLDALRGTNYGGVVDANTGLRGSGAGTLTVGDLAIFINNALGQDGDRFGAQLTIDGDGHVNIEALNPSTQGVMVHAATNLYRGQGITPAAVPARAATVPAAAATPLVARPAVPAAAGPPPVPAFPAVPVRPAIPAALPAGTLDALLQTELSENAAFYVADLETGRSMGGDAPLAFRARDPGPPPGAPGTGNTYADVLAAINQIEGVTAGFVHSPGPDGVAGGGDDVFNLEITADNGRQLRFVDILGTLMTGDTANRDFSLTQNDETFSYAGDGTTLVQNAFPESTTDTRFQIFNADTGEPLGNTAQVTRGGTVATMVAAFNAVPGVSAIQETVFTDPATNIAYSVVRVQSSDGRPLRITELAGDIGATSGLLQAEGSETSAATVTNAQSAAFPQANHPLARFDRVRTAVTAETMTIAYPNGATRMITIDPTTQSLEDVAAAIRALGAVGGPAGTGLNEVTLDARIINDNGRKLEVFVSGSDQRKHFGGSIGFTGDLADRLNMSTQETTNFSHYFGLNDFFVDANEDSLSQTIDVRADIKRDNALLARGRAVNAIATNADGATRPTHATRAITAGNNLGAAKLAEVMQANFSFDQIGDGRERFSQSSLNGTLSEYASRIVSGTGLETRIVQDEFEFRKTVLEELTFRLDGIQGVNMDQEMSDLILFQNAYQASARVVTVAQEVMDELIGLVR